MSTNDGAQFKFYLNRQGVQGKKGDKGDKGFSPTITPGQDTASTYTLQITNETGSFETTNLREHKEDRGGTYVRYDRTEEEMYLGEPNYASTTQYGEVKFCTDTEFTNASESTVVSPANVQDYVEGEVTTINASLSQLQDSVDTLDTLVTNINGQVQMNTADITTAEQNISALQGTVSGHTTTIGQIQSDVTALETEVDKNTTDITNLTSDVNTLETTVGEHTSDISALETGMASKLEASNIVAGENVSVSVSGNNVTISSTGGGGTGTTDYTQLTNKPQINSVELTGNKTSADLGLATASEVEGLDTELNSLSGTVTEVENSLANKQDILSVEAPLAKNLNTLSLTVGDGLSVVEGKLTANIPTVDTYSKAEIDTMLDEKQDVLTAGENITIENTLVGVLPKSSTIPEGNLTNGTTYNAWENLTSTLTSFAFEFDCYMSHAGASYPGRVEFGLPMLGGSVTRYITVQYSQNQGCLIQATDFLVGNINVPNINLNQNYHVKLVFGTDGIARGEFTPLSVTGETITVEGPFNPPAMPGPGTCTVATYSNFNVTGSSLQFAYSDGSDQVVISATAATPTNMVTTDTEQTISGAKTFTSSITISRDSVTYANVDAGNVSDYAVTFDSSTFAQGLKLWKGTQAEYDAVSPKDDHILYVVVADGTEG